eukprot:Phypoly_transcript_17568.p1 GENE.Phypoly_transcript_17568~~Phypoly_transcript_17568.p1  ORF type:complete len:207 (+),score=49.62 Phypoly_transcript_17568:113-733(+)
MACRLYSLVGPAEETTSIPHGAFGLVPPDHKLYYSLSLYANPVPPGYIVVHTDTIKETVAKSLHDTEAELINKYDSALKSSQELLLKKQQQKQKEQSKNNANRDRNTKFDKELIESLQLSNDNHAHQMTELEKRLEEQKLQIEARQLKIDEYQTQIAAQRQKIAAQQRKIDLQKLQIEVQQIKIDSQQEKVSEKPTTQAIASGASE